MIRWALTIVFSFLAASSWAQDIVVRTGDHPSFTRIVFSPPSGTEWNLVRTTEGYRLGVTEPATLNTALFFERIQRDRIAAIRPGQSGSELIIELTCDCFAEAFQWRLDQVVIDIKDPGSEVSADALPIADLRLSRDEPLQITATQSKPEQDQTNPVLIDMPSPPVPDPTESSQPSLKLPLIIAENQPPPNRQSAIDPLNQLLTQQTRVGTLEGAISDSLGRALSQGLLDPGAADPARIDAKPLQPEISALLESVEAALTPGVVARTSVDQEDASTILQDQSNNGVACIPNALVDIPSWYSDTPFSSLIGDLRTKITSEFDRTDPEAVENLAKAYITFGFGREAISTLSIDDIDSRSRQVLTTLAQIIDADPITKSDFHLQIGCPGPVALWGFLAHQDGPMPAQPNVNGIIVSFKLLPKELREHLAPRLAQKLNSLGYQDFADDILSIGDETKIDVTTTQLEILTDRGANQEVAARLTELVDDNPRIPPETLMQLIDLDLAADKPIGADKLTLLRTFQFEAQDEGLRGELYKTEIRVMISMEAFEPAKSLIDTHEDILSSRIADSLRSEIYGEVVANQDDAHFLKVAFNPIEKIKDPGVQNTYAKRLLALGFPDRAKTFIKEDTIGDHMMERRFLRAEAYMTTGDATQAEAHLAGISTERAQQILTGSKQVNSNTSALMGPLGSNPRNDPLLLNIAERVEDTTTFDANSSTPLTDGRALADEAAILRQDSAALIERYGIRR